jgi:hypothetical protein
MRRPREERAPALFCARLQAQLEAMHAPSQNASRADLAPDFMTPILLLLD